MTAELRNPNSGTTEHGFCEKVFDQIASIKLIDPTERPIKEDAYLIVENRAGLGS
jgi:hypothetical protein